MHRVGRFFLKKMVMIPGVLILGLLFMIYLFAQQVDQQYSAHFSEANVASVAEEDYGRFDYKGPDQHQAFSENDFIDAAEENTSTFSADVNTASYTLMRRDLNRSQLPDIAGVRVEEYINFFRYDYPEPLADEPFSVTMEAAPSYFGRDAEDGERTLLRIGIKARDIPIEEMRPNNLVFLVDVSGSMAPDNRLPLAKKSLHILLENLRPTDTVAIQTYASGTDTVLKPTAVSKRAKILRAIDGLNAKGGTNGEGGVVAAYDLAEQGMIEGGNNR
ncbi:MAG: vWA domain-containing protein, partial [Bradymonadaceae bacterium]